MIKRLLFFLMISMVSSSFAFAQVYSSVGATKFDEKASGSKVEHSSIVSFGLGYLFEIPISAKLSINPGIGYSNLGTTATNTLGNSDQKIITRIDYLVLPIDFKYKFKPQNSFFLSAGGYYGYAVKVSGTINGEDYEGTINEGDYSYRNSDYGVNLGVGYVFRSRLFLKAVYSSGLANIMNYPESTDSHIKNTNIGLSIGYSLFRKPI